MGAMIDRRRFGRTLSLAAVSAAAIPKGSSGASARRIIRPRRLEVGDTIGMVLPASAAPARDAIAFAREQLEAVGFKVRLGEHAYDRHGYFAGTDEERAADLNRMFADDSIDGIVCYTGGWGSPRILPLLDYALIARKPKVLVGFSDITALLIAIHQRTGLVTFHGPVGASTFSEYSVESFRRVVMTPEPAGLLEMPAKRPSDLVDRVNRIVRLAPGRATGRLTGGNLTLVAALMGTPYEIDCKGAILFLEDVDEQTYRIDRMLTQLALAGKFEEMAGMVFGRCTDCEGRTLSLEDVLRDRFEGGRPALAGHSFGHIENKLTLPVGVLATLDADAGTLRVDEPAVV